MLCLNSKGNAAIGNGMDDHHSYFVLLNNEGQELWKIATGRTFTGCHAAFLDFFDDEQQEFWISNCKYDKTDSTEKDYSTEMVLYNFSAAINFSWVSLRLERALSS